MRSLIRRNPQQAFREALMKSAMRALSSTSLNQNPFTKGLTL